MKNILMNGENMSKDVLRGIKETALAGSGVLGTIAGGIGMAAASTNPELMAIASVAGMGAIGSVALYFTTKLALLNAESESVIPKDISKASKFMQKTSSIIDEPAWRETVVALGIKDGGKVENGIITFEDESFVTLAKNQENFSFRKKM